MSEADGFALALRARGFEAEAAFIQAQAARIAELERERDRYAAASENNVTHYEAEKELRRREEAWRREAQAETAKLAEDASRMIVSLGAAHARATAAEARVAELEGREREAHEDVALAASAIERATEWQAYAESMERAADNAMAEEIQRLRREKPAAEAERDRMRAALVEIRNSDVKRGHPCEPPEYGYFGRVAAAALAQTTVASDGR